MNTDNNINQNTLTSEMEALKSKVDEMENNWKRALADYKNLEKRALEEKFAFASFANTSIIQRILPVLDNLELVNAHISDTGLKMTIKEFKQVLNEEGVTEINPEGKEFDATNMEAIDMVENPEMNNKVISVISKGYMLKDKLIRPARVKVGK